MKKVNGVLIKKEVNDVIGGFYNMLICDGCNEEFKREYDLKTLDDFINYIYDNIVKTKEIKFEGSTEIKNKIKLYLLRDDDFIELYEYIVKNLKSEN